MTKKELIDKGIKRSKQAVEEAVKSTGPQEAREIVNRLKTGVPFTATNKTRMAIWITDALHEREKKGRRDGVWIGSGMGLKRAAKISVSGSYYRPEWEHHAINVQIAKAIEAEIKD